MTPLGDAGYALEPAPADAFLNVVFVHGFKGNALDTWTWRPSAPIWSFWRARPEGVLLPVLLSRHSAVPCRYYTVAHSAGIRSPTDIERAAGVLSTFIKTAVLPRARLPVVLVAHSFGGLACREAILGQLEHEEDPCVIGLLMLGTPNAGTEIARMPEWLGSGSGRDMAPFNDRLARLNREWARRVVNGGHPDESPAQRAPIECWAAVGTEDRVVTGASASTLASFADVYTLNKGHVQLPKASGPGDLTYSLVERFIQVCRGYSQERSREWAARTLAHRLRSATRRMPLVRRETVQIGLRASDLPHVHACRVVEQREGGMLGQRTTLCLACSGLAPEIDIEFEWEIGQGAMQRADFDRMVARGQSLIDDYFRVRALSVSQGGREGDLVRVGHEAGEGWHARHYRAPDWFDHTRPYDVLRLEADTYTDTRQGWMHYSTRRTVTERLELSFAAPFPFSAVARLGRGSRLGQPTPAGDVLVSRARVEGPVSVGRQMVWIYHDPTSAPAPPTVQPATPPAHV